MDCGREAASAYLRGFGAWTTTIEANITSIMKLVKLDRSDPTALHEQVAAQIRRSIAEGDASPGDRLPPARDFAAVMHVNANTVLRALRDLRDEGLLEFRRGLGVRVAGTPERGIVLSGARELLVLARRHGYRREELVEMIQRLG
jgi:GntR family transcriptional regulator